MTKELQREKLTNIRPYEKNPRKNDAAVEAVAESIRQCGYVAPIIVDEDGVILAGHTRYKALRKLGVTEAEQLRAVTGLLGLSGSSPQSIDTGHFVTIACKVVG